MKTMAWKDNFSCCYCEDPTVFETKLVLNCFVAAMATNFR
jgi:hypothetical protein